MNRARSHRPTAFIGGIIAVLVLAGCGSTKSASSTTTSTTTTETTTSTTQPTTTTTAPLTDEQLVRSLVLTAKDLPAGWTGKPTPADPPAVTAKLNALNACFGLGPIDEGVAATATGDTFTKGSTAIATVVQATDGTTNASDELVKMKDSSKFPCAEKALNAVIRTSENLPDSFTLDSEISVNNQIPAGTADLCLQMKTTISANGVEFVGYTDSLFFDNGRIGTTLTIASTDTPPSPDIVNTVAKTMAGKLAGKPVSST